MCYLLIGNISALISADYVEPLSDARLRVYLPDYRYPTVNPPKKNIFSGPVKLTPDQVAAKRERLLAETMLDECGNFTIEWEQLHLFTEPLELDLCIQRMPGQASGKGTETQYNLSAMAPHWKRSRERYVAAYAYVIPAESWSRIRAGYGTWVIAGTVRHAHSGEALSQLKVEVYNAGNQRLLARTSTNEKGHYRLGFSRKELTTGNLLMIREGQPDGRPDVYFKVYRDNTLLWEENDHMEALPERKAIAFCSVININVKPSDTKKTTGYIPSWLSSLAVGSKRSSLVSY